MTLILAFYAHINMLSIINLYAAYTRKSYLCEAFPEWGEGGGGVTINMHMFNHYAYVQSKSNHDAYRHLASPRGVAVTKVGLVVRLCR